MRAAHVSATSKTFGENLHSYLISWAVCHSLCVLRWRERRNFCAWVYWDWAALRKKGLRVKQQSKPSYLIWLWNLYTRFHLSLALLVLKMTFIRWTFPFSCPPHLFLEATSFSLSLPHMWEFSDEEEMTFLLHCGLDADMWLYNFPTHELSLSQTLSSIISVGEEGGNPATNSIDVGILKSVQCSECVSPSARASSSISCITLQLVVCRWEWKKVIG